MVAADFVSVEGAPTRPHVHFTPPSGWLNDPNGLVLADGVYHLCYQHQPDSLLWGPMHWGHAVSRDLVHWEHRPLALRPDHLGTAFSGSAVVDEAGVAGLGAGALLAFYTHFVDDHQPQSQGVASSSDGGVTWTPYPGNPVLEPPEGLVDFRDPKVFRWGGDDGHWVMVVAAGHEVVLHRSDDLLAWTECSRFGLGFGAHEGAWETPDLFELAVEKTGEPRWVLVVSVLAGGPAGGTGTQYFVGSFDGETFSCDQPAEEVRWVDHGADFYAPQSWSGVPGGRRLWIAWMSNWAYARTVPASTWRGMLTVPREVHLLRGDDGRAVLAQQPAAELQRHGRVVVDQADVSVTPEQAWTRDDAPETYELRLRLRPGGPCTVEVHRGAGVATRVRYDPEPGVLTVTRDHRGLLGVEPHGGQRVVTAARNGVVDLRVVVDTCSVEVFADEGRVVLTNQVFPDAVSRGVAVTAQVGSVELVAVTLIDLSCDGCCSDVRPD